MTKSHSNGNQDAAVMIARCDKCGGYFQELFILVWARSVKLIGFLFCIDCDPEAEKPVCQSVTDKGKSWQ